MTVLNRKKAPRLAPPAALHIQAPTHYTLPNGLPVCLFNMGDQDVVMLKLLFPAGTWQESSRQVAAFTARLLREGTVSYPGQTLMNRIEYCGATLQTKAKNNHAEIVVYSLTKHLPQLLPLLYSILTESEFLTKELNTIVQNAKQHLRIQQEKTDYLAHERFREGLFGEQHPYGYRSTSDDYDRLTRDELYAFYQRHYSAENCVLYLAGKLSDQDLQLIAQYLGGDNWLNQHRIGDIAHNTVPFVPQAVTLHKPGAVQAAICIGCPMFNKTHPDYQAMMVLNTILGGFFGSRLMNNIREEKGYTYGIYSTLHSYMDGGDFAIITDVNGDVWEDAVREIYREMELLQNELVPAHELELVRNYLNGTILSQLSGTFNLAATLQGILVYGLDIDFYHRFVETINTVSPQQLRDLAQRYLSPANMLQVVARA